MEALKDETKHLGHRVEASERTQETFQGHLEEHHKVLVALSKHISQLLSHLDDIDNRHRRNNLRIRGVSELVQSSDLELTVQVLFHSLLKGDESSPIEMDRVHRALGPKSANPSRPRNIVCRVHFYKVKEAILKAARQADKVEVDGFQVQIMPDLSRRTLQLRRAVRPILTLLKNRDIQYRWGFPFQLHARRDGKLAIFRDLGDLPKFLETFSLPSVSLPDWPSVSSPPQ
ncbi:uncharacterized protein LOC120988885 [Bufo bufo]|uniref:uncharacterized protein LOC120988885 n=1 Tax=Bufo bufo TaxID=8384 RepID=UPI001ABE8C6B|nr:uncharacterized protein LOC120988885 [Bufo bufo]